MSALFKPACNKARALGDARARLLTLAIAGQAGLKVRDAGLDLPPLSAGYLYVLPAHLLLAPTTAGIAFAKRQAEPAIRAARADALIVSRPVDGPPQLALGLWSRAETNWVEDITPWLGTDGTIWLALPSVVSMPLAYPLTAAPLKSAPAPWYFADEFEAGVIRAAAWLGSF